jgi:hypothetical protein
VYGSLDFDKDYVVGCQQLIKELRLENNVALRGLGSPTKVGGGGYRGQEGGQGWDGWGRYRVHNGLGGWGSRTWPRRGPAVSST